MASALSLRERLRPLRASAWLGFQIESNWSDPIVFAVYALAKPLATSLILLAMYKVVIGGAISDPRFVALVDRIYTIERIEPLITRAKERIKEHGIRNVRFRHGDGTQGWKSHAPFDGILVAAAPLILPEELVKQLKVGGRLLVPVGGEGEQQLIRITRKEQRIERESLGPVAFVPLLGGTT